MAPQRNTFGWQLNMCVQKTLNPAESMTGLWREGKQRDYLRLVTSLEFSR